MGPSSGSGARPAGRPASTPSPAAGSAGDDHVPPPVDRRRARAAGSAGAALAAAGGAGAVFAANLGGSAHRHGARYLWRLALWGRRESMDDPARFPARPIAPAPRPFRFAEDPTGPARLRAALRAVGPRHGLGAVEAPEAFLARTRTTSLLVLDGDRLAYEGYANGAARGDPLTSMSRARSVLGLPAVAAVADGPIPGFDAPAEALLPDAPGLRGSGVALRHLLRMASGLRFEDPRPFGPLTWPLLFDGARVAYFTPYVRAYAETARPGPHPPGARFAYGDRGAQLVGLALGRAFGRGVSGAFGDRIWRRIGADFDPTPHHKIPPLEDSARLARCRAGPRGEICAA